MIVTLQLSKVQIRLYRSLVAGERFHGSTKGPFDTSLVVKEPVTSSQKKTICNTVADLQCIVIF